MKSKNEIFSPNTILSELQPVRSISFLKVTHHKIPSKKEEKIEKGINKKLYFKKKKQPIIKLKKEKEEINGKGLKESINK